MDARVPNYPGMCVPVNSRVKKKSSEKDQVLIAIEVQNRSRETEKPPRQLFLRNLSHALSVRVLQFVVVYLAVSLLLYAQEDSGSGVTSLRDIYPLQILAFTAAVFVISAATTCFVSDP